MSSVSIKHYEPHHPYIFNHFSWEKYYRKHLHHIYRRLKEYARYNKIEGLFRNIDYAAFVEYMYDHSYHFRNKMT